MTNQNDQWDSCPPGEITRMVAAVHRKRRQATIKWFASLGGSVCLVLAVLTVATVVWVNQLPAKNLTCREVVDYMQEYHQGILGVGITASIEAHLSDCPSCNDHYEEYDDGVSSLPAGDKQVARVHDAPTNARNGTDITLAHHVTSLR